MCRAVKDVMVASTQTNQVLLSRQIAARKVTVRLPRIPINAIMAQSNTAPKVCASAVTDSILVEVSVMMLRSWSASRTPVSI